MVRPKDQEATVTGKKVFILIGSKEEGTGHPSLPGLQWTLLTVSSQRASETERQRQTETQGRGHSGVSSISYKGTNPFLGVPSS